VVVALPLDRVQLADPSSGLQRPRRVTRLGLEEVASRVRPTADLDQFRVGPEQFVIAGVGIGLQVTAISSQPGLRSGPRAVGRVVEDHERVRRISAIDPQPGLQRLSLPVSTLRQWIRTGVIKACQPYGEGGRIYLTADSIEDMVAKPPKTVTGTDAAGSQSKRLPGRRPEWMK